MNFFGMRSSVITAPLIAAGCLLGSCASKPTAGPVTAAKVTIAYQATRAASIEPCGCQSRPWGGLDREYNALNKLRGERITFYFDAGNSLVGDLATKATTASATKKAEAIAAMLSANGLDVLSPGQAEYSLGSENLKKVAAASRFSWVSSNVTEKKKALFS